MAPGLDGQGWRAGAALQRVRAAVERGADVDGVMASGYYTEDVAPLHHVAAIGNDRMARMLVEGLGANVDVVEPDDGSTPMHIASAAGNTEMVKTLAQLGANLDKPNIAGWTPLLMASWQGHTPTVIALLALGADPSIATTRATPDIPAGSTPLSIAQAKGHADVVHVLSGKAKSAKKAKGAKNKKSKGNKSGLKENIFVLKAYIRIGIQSIAM